MRQAGQKAEHEEQRSRFIEAAFIGWQYDARGYKRFNDYLKALGLTDSGHQSATRVTASQALKDAAKIAAADKKGH